MKIIGIVVAAAASLCIAAGPGQAEVFPSRPIELVTHASAGGGTDTTARTMLINAPKELGVDTFVQIKKGGGGAVAMSYVASKPADGYTLMAITPTHLITMARGRAPIGIDDIRGVVRSTDDPIIIIAQRSTGYASVEDLKAASEKAPIKWGGTQAGGIDHIASMTFAKRADVKVSYVPFEGGGEIITNLMGGSIQAAGLNYGEAVDGIDSGDFVPIAVMAPKRMASLPDTPTLKELGIEGVNFSTVRGVVVMADTPDDRANVLEETLLASMSSDTYQNYLRGIGLGSDSVEGSAEWDAQIREMYQSIYDTLEELGLRK